MPNASEVLSAMYVEMDRHAEEAGKRLKATCSKGCASCCHILALCTLAEALLIAEKLLMKPDWKAVLPKLREHALAAMNETTSSYAKKLIPCAFLTPEKTCGIYDVRPSCCRYYMVASDPAKCSALAVDKTVTIIDLSLLEMEVWALNAEVCKQAGLNELSTAVLPIIVLHTMLLIADGDAEEKKVLEEACKGIPTPPEWMFQFIQRDDGTFSQHWNTLASKKMRGEL